MITWLLNTYWTILNGRSFYGLVINFFKNFSLVILWLTLFKSSSKIPVEWRPAIHVQWLPLSDEFIFNPKRFTSYFSYSIILMISFLVYKLFFCYCYENNDHKVITNNDDICINTTNTNNTTTNIHNSFSYRKLTPIMLLVTAWPLLNLIRYFSDRHETHILDLIAFTSYVILHLTVPIVSSFYFYLFHKPGVLASYALSLGLQNILGLTTHILIPSSPPWFVHLNGINAAADYSTLGYSAGLSRINSTLGSYLTNNGFHKSPIVFGALPSLHSAMAVITFLYVSWFSSSILATSLSLSFVILQWWATIYLDHHWRLDLLAGLLYSLSVFILFKYLNPRRFNENYDSSINSQFDLELQSINSHTESDTLEDFNDFSTDFIGADMRPAGQRIFNETPLKFIFL